MPLIVLTVSRFAFFLAAFERSCQFNSRMSDRLKIQIISSQTCLTVNTRTRIGRKRNESSCTSEMGSPCRYTYLNLIAYERW